MDLSKFQEDGKKSELGEAGSYLLRVFSGHIARIENLINRLSANRVIAKGAHTTVGGAVAEDILNPAIKMANLAHAQIKVEGAVPVTIKSAKCGVGKITVEFSADPGNDHQLTYLIL